MLSVLSVGLHEKYKNEVDKNAGVKEIGYVEEN